jgi:phosphohistidine phosphatase
MLQPFYIPQRGEAMILYIVRHAIAEEHNPRGSDESRELTKDGVEKMKKAAAGLRAAGAIPEVILTSPLVRARHTAEILMDAFQGNPVLKEMPALAPSGNRIELYKEIRKHEKAESVMLVGHQPSLGEIAGEIAFGSAEYALELKKGAACAIELHRLSPKPQGSLLWFATPLILRQIGVGQ